MRCMRQRPPIAILLLCSFVAGCASSPASKRRNPGCSMRTPQMSRAPCIDVSDSTSIQHDLHALFEQRADSSQRLDAVQRGTLAHELSVFLAILSGDDEALDRYIARRSDSGAMLALGELDSRWDFAMLLASTGYSDRLSDIETSADLVRVFYNIDRTTSNTAQSNWPRFVMLWPNDVFLRAGTWSERDCACTGGLVSDVERWWLFDRSIVSLFSFMSVSPPAAESPVPCASVGVTCRSMSGTIVRFILTCTWDLRSQRWILRSVVYAAESAGEDVLVPFLHIY